MNQLVQYVMIFGVVGVFFAVLYAAGLAELAGVSESQLQRLERYQEQVQEGVAMVEVVSGSSPAVIDVINTGDADVRVERVFANGTQSVFSTRAMNTTLGVPTGGVLPPGTISRISVPGGDVPLLVVTENGRTFLFGG